MATTQNTYTGNGSTTDYTLTFPYIAVADVRVSLDDIGTTAFSLINAATLRFNSAPGNGVAIRIYRVTDDSNNKIVFSSGSSIKADDLNDAINRNLYIAQETTNNLSNVTAGGIADGSLMTAKIADDAVSSFKIGPSAVDSTALADDAVIESKIADDAVTSTKLATDAVAETKIATDAVTETKIADNAVTEAKIADNAVTEAKVSGNNGFVPTGAIFYFADSTAPTGYLKLNGDTIPNGTGTVQGQTADFSALYALIGGTLPDVRGEFLRCWDNGRGVDQSRAMRSQQKPTAIRTAVQAHQINNAASTNFDVSAGISFAEPETFTGSTPNNARFGDNGTGFNSNYANNILLGGQDTSASGRNTWITTRPRNVALLACIKY